MQTTWLERGTVSGRVALLLRSAEIQPLFIDLSDWIHTSNPPLQSSNGRLQLQGGLPVGWAAAKGMPCVFDAVLQAAAEGLAAMQYDCGVAYLSWRSFQGDAVCS